MLDTMKMLQYDEDKHKWILPPPSFESSLIVEYWVEVMPPASINWWAVGWKSGAITYYKWVKMNPCSQVIEIPDIGALPGPPGPTGPPDESVRQELEELRCDMQRDMERLENRINECCDEVKCDVRQINEQLEDIVHRIEELEEDRHSHD